MDRRKYSIITCLLLFFIVRLACFPSAFGDGGQHRSENEQKRPTIVKIAIDKIFSKKSHESSWDKVKSIIHQVQSQFFPPNLEGADEANTKGEIGGAGERIKQAAENSIGASKMTAEESAKSAAKVVGEAMHKTAQKMKDKLSRHDEIHDEL